jgi:hypothetical protein
MRPLEPLPPDCRWLRRPGPGVVYELSVRRYPVASAERLSDGRWLTRVGILWADHLHREAVAGSPHLCRQAGVSTANIRIDLLR